MSQRVEREKWIDQIKGLACILVVVGHFSQSMDRASLISSNEIFDWFEHTIYLFHVPLFLICSGYLYQKYTNTTSFNNWLKNVRKKLISLGIPYFVFTIISWILKTVFRNDVSIETVGLIETLFIEPLSPYWYLYVLFLLFFLIPTFKNKKSMFIVMFISIVVKMLYSTGLSSNIYLVNVLMEYSIWFVVGMAINLLNIDFLKTKNSIVVFMIFVLLSTINLGNNLVDFSLGLLACYSLLSYFINTNIRFLLLDVIAKYSMSIYLMHTIFSAGLRVVMIKVGINSALLHVILGLMIGFIGPVIAEKVMEKFNLDILIYPYRYIKKKELYENING